MTTRKQEGAGKKKGSGEGDSSMPLILAGCAVVAAAVGYFVFASSSSASDKASSTASKAAKKKKKKKKEQQAPKKEIDSEPVTAPSTKKAAPAEDATPVATSDAPAKDAAKKPAAKPKKPKKSKKLQTSGQLPDGVLTKFFNASNELLTKEETQNHLIASHKEGKDIGEELKMLQEAEWRNLGVDPDFGMKQVQGTLQTKMQTEAGLREALMTAAAAEESALMCGILGSREKFDQEQKRMKSLYEQGVQQFHAKLQEMSTRGDRQEMETFGREVMEKFQQLVAPLNTVKTDVDRIRLRLEMKDDDVIALIMGERLMQMQYEAQQQMGMAPGPM